jgi:hypothetical protein
LLQKLPLHKLELDGTGVDSRAITELAKLKSLHQLTINISHDDLAKFKKTIPQGTVVGVAERISPDFLHR